MTEYRPKFLSTDFHGTAPGADGQYELELSDEDRGYRCRVRMEAPGYRTALSEQSYGQSDGRVRIDFALEPAPARIGRIVDANGRPVTGATVLEASPSVVPMMHNSEAGFGDRSVKTSADGKFELLATLEPIRVRVTHESGFAEVMRQPSESIGELKLQPWASLEGQLSQAGELLAEQLVMFSPLIDRQLGEARFQDSYQVMTDAQGRFSFERLPPIAGRVRVYLGPWRDSPMTSSLSMPLELQPGETHRIHLGGNGATVSGRVITMGRDNRTLNKNWSINWLISRDRGVNLPEELRQLGFDPRGQVQPSWFLNPDSNSWLSTREHFFVKLAPDGQLTVHGVPAGIYDLILRLYEEPAGCLVETVGETVITIEVTENDIASGKKEIGGIKVSCRTGPRVGENMRAHEFTDTAGRVRSIAEMEGRYVLMHVWASWCGPCIEQMPGLKAYVDSHDEKPATFVGLNIDDDRKRANTLAERYAWNWPQDYLGEDSKMARQLAVSSVPTYFLIGRDGKLVAAENDWGKVKAKLDELLDVE